MTCDNCKLKIARQNYTIHTLHCARHLEVCNKCGEPVPKDKLKDHMNTEHAEENCTKCGKSMEKGLLQEHAQSDCPKRLISCLYCELELPSNEMIAHAEYCGTRTEKCTECGEFVMLKYTQLHLESNHKFLKLQDEPGPSASWESNTATASKARAISPENVGESTLLPCEFCDGMFTPRELRRHQVSCTHGWDTTVPVLRRISVVKCQVCGKSIASRDYEDHCLVCVPPSPPSRSNLSNGNVIPCDVCHRAIPFEEYATHSNLCSKYSSSTVSDGKPSPSQRRKEFLISCDICNESIPAEEFQKHCILCVKPVLRTPPSNEHFREKPAIDSIPKLPCEFCDESFSPYDLPAHQICCSPLGKQTIIPCELCGELKSLGEVLGHQLRCRVNRDV